MCRFSKIAKSAKSLHPNVLSVKYTVCPLETSIKKYIYCSTDVYVCTVSTFGDQEECLQKHKQQKVFFYSVQKTAVSVILSF